MGSLKSLTWFVDRLPGVRTRLASVGIRTGLVPGAMDDIFFLHGQRGPVLLVGPDAARLVLDAYRRGDLPMSGPQGGTPEIDAYLADDAKLRKEADRNRLWRSQADPFLDWRFMEETFRRAAHPIPRDLDVRGVRVVRHGDGRDSAPQDISFTWEEGGTPRTLRHGEHPDPRIRT